MKLPSKFYLVSLIFILFQGCLTPSVRYSRSGGPPKISTAENRNISAKRNQTVESTRSYSADRLNQVVNFYIGTPYRSGGLSRAGLDCSGFVFLVFREVYQIELPRSSRKQRPLGRPVAKRNAQAGDLVFFKNIFGTVNHVGIYIGNNTFAHASSSRGVVRSDLEEEYYKKRLLDIRRFL